ncbi:MAG: N-formylglutamate amidohydrolase [Pseudomonadota bacterium]
MVYDCNRPPEAASAMPERSEDTDIPGNANLTTKQRQIRVERYYRPFEALLSETLERHPVPPVLVTIHSFTPVFHGQRRTVEIGVLHDRDSRLADALLHVASGYDVQRNAPYRPEDGVTHTLCRHGLARGILNVMIEIRNDLITAPDQCAAMAATLEGWLTAALDLVAHSGAQEAAR